jgi:tRNA-2-methylthio-N6-dimethylallyladenosine synthase
LINEQQREFNQKSVGLTMPILFDRKGKREGQLVGRSPYNQSVFVEASERLLNTLNNVKISEGFDNSLTGAIETHEEILGSTN